jgi:hypothetical protein
MVGFPILRRFVGSILMGIFWVFVVAVALATAGALFN